MTIDIHRHRQTGDVGGKSFNMDRQSGHPTPETLGADPQLIDLSQEGPFQIRIKRIGAGPTEGPQQGLFGQNGHPVKSAADPYPDHEGRTGVGTGLFNLIDDKVDHSPHPVGRGQHF